MAEDDADDRRENARLAAEHRIRAVAIEAMREDRFQFWDQMGFNVRGDAGQERLRLTLAGMAAIGIDPTNKDQVAEFAKVMPWIAGARMASETRNTRVLKWITTAVSLVGGMILIVKFYLEWRGVK